ncbi:hypothetical protein GJAV_G00214460 [Gymnothorax javanicus]|nr:hypothetical protein GJAV_G00214460 [Gymnothorax javanicus]
MVGNPPHLPDRRSSRGASGKAWLKQYGYLPPSDQPHSGEDMEAAIRRMQKFAGLPETGKLDSPTVARMSMPRCSRPDVETGSQPHSRRMRRYALTGYYWNKTELTWSLENYPSQIVSPFLSCNLVPRILTFAMKAWTDVTPLCITERRSGKKTGDIQVSFLSGDHGDGYPFDGRRGVLAHAFLPGDYELAGDVHFDNAESWSYGSLASSLMGKTQDFDLFSVAVHEFGHSLGLGHSSTQTAIMYPYYQGPVLNFHKYKLPEDDRKGIQAIYGKKPLMLRPCPRPKAKTHGRKAGKKRSK